MDTGLRILILEDFAPDIELEVRALRAAGIRFEYRSADTRERFEQELGQFAPDLILADYTLPSFDGQAALRIARERYADIPFIFVAGTIGEERAIELMKNGATDYVLKNRLSRLIPSVQRAVREHRDLEEKRLAEENLRVSLAKLQKAMEGVVQIISLVIELRDPYTSGHQKRVANLARSIAEEMRLQPDRVEAIFFAGSIHDLGKIHVPAEILNKPAPVSEIEFSLFKMHPQIGYDLLKLLDFPWPIAPIVYQHHERFNGSGYPGGLANDAILPEARILAVADVIESMTSHRPYRAAIDVNSALEHLSMNRGILYDPASVDACVTLFREKGFRFQYDTDDSVPGKPVNRG